MKISGFGVLGRLRHPVCVIGDIVMIGKKVIVIPLKRWVAEYKGKEDILLWGQYIQGTDSRNKDLDEKPEPPDIPRL